MTFFLTLFLLFCTFCMIFLWGKDSPNNRLRHANVHPALKYHYSMKPESTKFARKVWGSHIFYNKLEYALRLWRLTWKHKNRDRDCAHISSPCVFMNSRRKRISVQSCACILKKIVALKALFQPWKAHQKEVGGRKEHGQQWRISILTQGGTKIFC